MMARKLHKKSKEKLITVIRNNTNNTKITRTTKTIKQNGKKLPTALIIKATNKRNIFGENIDMAKKRKSYERNLISSNSSTK